MWDQNPMLHKRNIDELARPYLNEVTRQRKTLQPIRFARTAATLSGIAAIVIVIGSTVI